MYIHTGYIEEAKWFSLLFYKNAKMYWGSIGSLLYRIICKERENNKKVCPTVSLNINFITRLKCYAARRLLWPFSVTYNLAVDLYFDLFFWISSFSKVILSLFEWSFPFPFIFAIEFFIHSFSYWLNFFSPYLFIFLQWIPYAKRSWWHISLCLIALRRSLGFILGTFTAIRTKKFTRGLLLQVD